MKQTTLLFSCTFSLISNAQNFQSHLPSENFFSPYSLHRSSIAILPTFNYHVNSKGQFFNSENSGAANFTDYMTTLLKNGKSRNYLSFNIQSSLLDYRRKTKKGEMGFGMGIKAGGLFQSIIDYPELPGNKDSNLSIFNQPDPRIKIRINTYTAVSYSFSYLRNISKKHLHNYGFKIELLTGLNAIKGYFKSSDLQAKDTNNINLIIERKGYIVRSKDKMLPEEILPFHRNPGLAVSYGLKWQLSSKNRLAVNLSNLGFIYFSRSKNYLHRGIDSINLKSKTNPYKQYNDSLKSWSNDHNETFYFLPFEINANFEHQFNNRHSFMLRTNYNPIIKNLQLCISASKTIYQFLITPSLNLVNSSRVMSGLGIAKNSKFISWGINVNYLVSSIELYKGSVEEKYNFKTQNYFHSTLYVYYHFIKKTKRLTSRNHRMTRTYVRN